MKILAFLFAIYMIFGSLFGSSFMPEWWDNPHTAFFGAKQSKLFSYESKVKPDLSRIKENLYMPIEVKTQGQWFHGMITVKPQEQGTIKIGGAVYQAGNTDALGILDGQLIDKGTYYEIQFTSKNASQLFKSKIQYQQATDFPSKLEIRGYGSSNMPYIIPPLERANDLYIKFLPLHVDLEKNFLGKWKSSGFEGDWEFEFSSLPGSQITGVAYYSKYGGIKCGYPMFGFPVGRNQITFMTGESTNHPAECRTYSWYSKSEDSNTIFFDPIRSDDPSMSLVKRQ